MVLLDVGVAGLLKVDFVVRTHVDTGLEKKIRQQEVILTHFKDISGSSFFRQPQPPGIKLGLCFEVKIRQMP